MQRRGTQVAAMLREAFAVLAAILVAFGLDAWWDGRVDQARADALLAEVSDEFKSAVVQLDSIVELNERTAATAFRFVRESGTGAAIESWDGFWNAQIYDPSFGALTSLLSAGGLENVRDRELRRALADWPAQLMELEFDVELFESAVGQMKLAISAEGIFPDYDSDGLLVPLSPDDLEEKQRSPSIRVSAYNYGAALREYNSELRVLRDRAERIALMIEASAL
jgi:hypothetical protein